MAIAEVPAHIQHTMPAKIAALSQHLLPKQLITHLAGKVASWNGGGTTRWIIQRFIDHYKVDMAEAAETEPGRYASFNEFFTRALRPGARPIAQASVVSPVDGSISQLGSLEHDRLVQAKGHKYTSTALLAGDVAEAERFHDGTFATIYLSPRDYHRVHMPCNGILRRMVYVPGDLYSVNPTTAQTIPGLFARNERVVCFFDGPLGPFALVLVGATIVGSMATVWHGVVNPPRHGTIRAWDYPARDIALKQGEEMGRFLLGSTVVLLFPGVSNLHLDRRWQPGKTVHLGEAMAQQQCLP